MSTPRYWAVVFVYPGGNNQTKFYFTKVRAEKAATEFSEGYKCSASITPLYPSPPSLLDGVPGGGKLLSLIWSGTKWRAVLEYQTDRNEQHTWTGYGPTPESALQDAASRVK